MFHTLASTESYRWAGPGERLRCFCGKTLSVNGPHTEAFYRPQLGTTGPSHEADTATKCDYCRTIVEITYQRVG